VNGKRLLKRRIVGRNTGTVDLPELTTNSVSYQPAPLERWKGKSTKTGSMEVDYRLYTDEECSAHRLCNPGYIILDDGGE
jgi:hypothetical protein